MDRTAVSGTSGGGSIPSGATKKTGSDASLFYFTVRNGLVGSEWNISNYLKLSS